jgi:hypothetical protein
MRAEMRAEMRADSGEGDTIWRPGGGIGGRGWAAGSPGEWPDKRSPSPLSLSLARAREKALALCLARALSARARARSRSHSQSPLWGSGEGHVRERGFSHGAFWS